MLGGSLLHERRRNGFKDDVDEDDEGSGMVLDTLHDADLNVDTSRQNYAETQSR